MSGVQITQLDQFNFCECLKLLDFLQDDIEKLCPFLDQLLFDDRLSAIYGYGSLCCRARAHLEVIGNDHHFPLGSDGPRS